MKATEAKFLGFLKKSPQFVMPIYQRTYSWTERECRQLWDDIVRTGQSEPEELPYAIGLVRQALEKQMGNGQAEV